MPPATHPVADFPLTGAQLGKAYIQATFIYAMASLLPLLVFFCIFSAATLYLNEHDAKIFFDLFIASDGMPRPGAMIWIALTSFVFGFGAELMFYNSLLKKKHLRLTEVVGFDTSNLTGNGLSKIWGTLWRVALLFLPWIALEMVLLSFVKVPEQPTVELARTMAGGNFVLWLILSAVLAPLFEELIFRGIIFQALRTTLVRWYRRGAEVGSKGFTGWLGKTFVPSPGFAGFLAVVISGAIFALQHLQFEPITLLVLWAMGCFLAEIFRRTNNLWFSIGLHAVNNAVATLVVHLSQ